MESIRPSNVSKILCSALFVFAVMVGRGGAAATLEPEEWLREAEAAYDWVTTYPAVLHKQQRVGRKAPSRRNHTPQVQKKAVQSLHEMDKSALQRE